MTQLSASASDDARQRAEAVSGSARDDTQTAAAQNAERWIGRDTDRRAPEQPTKARRSWNAIRRRLGEIRTGVCRRRTAVEGAALALERVDDVELYRQQCRHAAQRTEVTVLRLACSV